MYQMSDWINSGPYQLFEESLAREHLHSMPVAYPECNLEVVVEQQEWDKIRTQTSTAETFQKCDICKDIFRIS